MATKDERPGLLSKVAMFVRNPTKDWSELDQPQDSEASGYDKQALKAMIERKRQNDFVRKREFDQLRKLRNRDPGIMASMARPSFFQNSLPTDLGGRAVTLKKIDEIEAQMSRQWWKGKTDGTTQPYTLPPRDNSVRESMDTNVSHPHSNVDMTAAFASTLPYDMTQADAVVHGNEYLPTQMAADMASVPGEEMPDGIEARSGSNAEFSTSRLFAIEVDEMATDPELEEAAIRFANSDDAGVQEGLLAALRGNDLAPEAAQSWAAALLDFYRASNQRTAFDAAALEFAVHLDGVQPVWCALGASLALADGAGPQTRIWDCPATLTAEAMESLRVAMTSKPMPWYLGWGDLERIAPDAVALVDVLFSSLCDEVVSLRFDGEDRITLAIRALTPSGERSVDPLCWKIRLNALRVLRLQDDFELAALDYCITFGVSPPEWTEARCRIAVSGVAGLPVPVGTQEAGIAASATAMELQGEILGDASKPLANLDAAESVGNRMHINCSDLVRVDFAAAGSILNWVAMRQAEGKQIQFQNVHRLVAAFFNVIGINEHAKVIPRPI
jgi:ABC-type transporter Mla MlaB component